jgi:Protein of unknown function (DUF3365)
MFRRLSVMLGLSVLAGATAAHVSSDEVAADEVSADEVAAVEAAVKTDPALERARREVRMLDDLYKTSIVLITEHYVKDGNDLPAGSAFKALFQTMKDKGWHEVRLLDATGQPYNDENWPKEGFEKRAVAKLVAGKASYDEVLTEDGQRYLLAATAIPVVLEKCIMCHENYRDVEKGKPIGALGYKLPILE